MEPRYKIVYIALGLVAASMLGDVAAYGQASIESPYDGEWLAKVSCTESIYRRPPFTYQAKIPVEKGRIQKTFQNTQENTTTTNTWTGSFTNNELKIEINGSNSNGEKWRYLLKGELNSPYAVSLIGPYFDARGNKSRTCNIAFNSTKPDELRQAAQRAEQETARLKQELAQKEQALAAAQASAVAASTQAQQELSQEAQAAIDVQRQAAQRAEQETARLKQELAQKEQALAAAQASAISERNQLQQQASQQAEIAATAQRQAAQNFALEIAQLKTEISQRVSELARLHESEAQRRNDLERTLREEAQNSITTKQNEVQRLASELADVKAQLSRSNPQFELLLEQEAKRRGELENKLRQEAQAAIDAQRRATQRAEQEIAQLKEELTQKDRIIEQERTASSVQLAQAHQLRVQEAQAAGDAQHQMLQRAEQEIARLREAIAQKDRVIEQEQKSLASPQQKVAQNVVQNQSNSPTAPNNGSTPTYPSQLKLSLDKLSVDIGGTRISGGGEIILKSKEGAAAQFELKITNFDKLENLAKTEIDPAPRNALALLKGYAETAGKDLVWRLRFDNNKLTLNGQDLTSVMSELSRNGGVPIEAYQISRVLLNAMPIGLVLDHHINIEGKLDLSTAGDPKGVITITLAGMEQLQSFVSKIPGAQELGPTLALIRGSGDLKDGTVNWTFRFAEQKIFLNSREIAKLTLNGRIQERGNSENPTPTSQVADLDLEQEQTNSDQTPSATGITKNRSNFIQNAIIGLIVTILAVIYSKLRKPRLRNFIRHTKAAAYLTRKRINLSKGIWAIKSRAETVQFSRLQRIFSAAKVERFYKKKFETFVARHKKIYSFFNFTYTDLMKKMRSETGLVIRGNKIYGWQLSLIVFSTILIISQIISLIGQNRTQDTKNIASHDYKGGSRRDFDNFLASEKKCVFIFETENKGRTFASTYDFRRAEVDTAVAVRTAELGSFSRSTRNHVNLSHLSGLAMLMPGVILVYGNGWVTDDSPLTQQKTTSNLNIEGLGAHPSITSLWFFDLPDEKVAFETATKINRKIKSCK